MSEQFSPKNHALTEEELSKVKYTNLKNHTGYTLQMGFGTTKEHIKTCYKKGHQACAFTDKGVMMGSLDLYNQAQDKKLLESIGYEGKSFPIIMGSSLFITEDTSVKNKLQKYYSISLYAKNQAGYENLCFLTSIASQDDKFYVKPRIDFFDLFENTNGLVCLSGGFNGVIGQAIYENHGQFRDEFFKLINSDSFPLVKDYLEKFASTNAPDKVSKLIEVMGIASDKEEYWRSFLSEESFWTMFPKLVNSPELWQLLKETQDMFPIEKEFFALADSLPWEEAEKGMFFNLMTDIKVEVVVAKFKEVFKDDFYFEFASTDLSRRWVKDLKQHEDIGENPQDRIQRKIVELAEKFDIKIILVQDSHMPNADQHLLQSIMIWNSPSGKDGWHFYEALEIMDIPTMYEKVVSLYPWVSDEQFLEWSNNSDEVLDKCRKCKLAFEPSLPELDYENHYVNKLPVVIQRSLMFELQERKLWSEVLKAKIVEAQDLSLMDEIPQDIKDRYNTKEKVVDFSEIEKRKEENIFLEEVLKKMKTFYKKEKDFVKLIAKSEDDLQLRTGLKVMIRNKKLLPKIIDEAKLQAIIDQRAPGKKSSDFKPEIIQNIITKYNLFTISDDPMMLLGGEIQRKRLVEELNTIQYNGIIKLMNYFMLLEDVSNFISENGHLRGFGRGCLVGDTLVLTKNSGLKKLSNIQEGDYVFTHKGNAKQVIKTFMYDIDEKLLEIQTSNSMGTIKLTKEHKVYGVKTKITENFKNSKNPDKQRKYEEIKHEPSFFPAQELKVGDLLFVKKPQYQQYNTQNIDLAANFEKEKAVVSENEIKWLNPLTGGFLTSHKRYIVKNHEFFYILGKWIGDGCVSYNEKSRKYVVAFAFNSKDEKEIARVEDYFNGYGFSVGKYYAKNKNLVTIEVYSKALALWFKSSFPEYKNSSNTKYIGDFKYIPEDYVKELFKGLMSADGHVGPQSGRNRTESFDTTSPKLRDEVKEICIYLGIPCTISTRKEHKSGKYLCRESYKIRFAGLNLDAKLLKNKIYEDGYYVKVKSLREVEAEPVYDLMIADEPSYTTSNFTVHNSGAGSIVAYALDITDCDPLEYDLLFERFLTKERIGEVFYEIEGVSLKDFMASQNQKNTIEVSSEDLKLDDEEGSSSGDDEEIVGEEV